MDNSDDKENQKMVLLRAKDGVILTISPEALLKTGVMTSYIDYSIGQGNADEIPVPDVESNELRKIIEFLEYHKRTDSVKWHDDFQQKILDPFDRKFMEIDWHHLLSLCLAAYMMNIPMLNSLCNWAIAEALENDPTRRFPF